MSKHGSHDVTMLAWLVLLLALGLVGPALVRASGFECPKEAGVFPDPEQCDKYWVCVGGRGTRTLCPDGLAFHPKKAEGEDPCDLIHNVPDKCKRRKKLQRAKPGDAHCPRQNGVYPSEDPGECDVFFTCRLGVGIPTKCSEGLHYSEQVGTCVWARDSQRVGCGASKEPVRKKKKKPAEQRATSAPTEKKTSAPRLSNGFVCPGGKLGVHIALPHPTDCRKFYTCLDGITPRDQGCPVGRVFNPTTSACDDPTNVVGCETYYNKPEPRRPPAPPPVAQVVRPSSAREEPRSSEGSLAGGQFSGFLAQLEKHGLLKPGALDALKNVMLEEEERRVEEKEEERMVGSPTGNRLSLKSLQQQRDSGLRTVSSTEASAPARTPVSRNSLFARRVPPKRRNKFTGFIPRVKPVGNTENIHPAGLIHEDITGEAEDREELTNVIPSEDPRDSELAELEHSDNEMLKNIVAAILSEEPSSTTPGSLIEAVTRGRKRLRGGNLFNPEGRRANSIFNRPRTRLRQTTTTSTTEASLEVEENLVEEEERLIGRPGLRLRGFRRPRPRPRFRPPSRLRPHLQDNEERELEEMMAALGENSPLKAEFQKFMKEQLGAGTGPRRFRPTGTLNRSKLRGLISRTKLRKQLEQQEEVEEELPVEEIKTSMKSSTEAGSTSVIFSPTVEPTTTTITTTTTTTTTSTTTTTIVTTRSTTTTQSTTITTTTTTTTSTTSTTTTTTTTTPPPPPTILTTTLREEEETTLQFLPTAPPPPSRPSLITLPAVPTQTNLVQVDATAPGFEDYGDTPFEYVYYEYYYDYEYEDDLTGPSASGPSGTGPSGTGPSGTGPSGTGPSGTGLSGPGLSASDPAFTSPGVSGLGFISSAEDPSLQQPELLEPRTLPTISASQPPTLPPRLPVPTQPLSFLQEAPRSFDPQPSLSPSTRPPLPVPPPARPPPSPTQPATAPPRPPTGPRRPPSPPRPQPPSLSDSSNFPHFQNFKPIDPQLDPPVHLPPPPRRITFEEPSAQQRAQREEERRIAEAEHARRIKGEEERQRLKEKQKQLEQQRIQEQLAAQAREEAERQQQKDAERQRQRERQELELQRQKEAEKRIRVEKEKELERKKQKEKEARKAAKESERERQFQKELQQQRQRKAENELRQQEESRSGAPAPARTLPQFPGSSREVEAGPTTFGPFSAFRNFPQFPRGPDTEGGLQNVDFITAPASPTATGEVRGPNLLPTRPTSRPGPQLSEVRRPPGPPPQLEDDLRFRPSAPQRESAPPVTVFAPSQTPPRPPPSASRPSPSPVVIPSGPRGPAIPQSPPPPGSTFQDQFFSVQTQLGQTQTRIPPQTRPPANQSPFTFFNQQQFNGQRQKSGPVSFPTENAASPTGPGRTLGSVVNNNIVHDPNAQSSSFFSFNSNSFQRGSPSSPEQPRTIQSVFGSSFQSPFSSGSSFFNGQGRPQDSSQLPQGQRFDSRPSPNSGPAVGQLKERPSPPLTVFNLPASTQRLTREPQGGAPSFPKPQFGGFRPIKRSGQVLPGEEDLFAEELIPSGSRRNTRKTGGGKKKNNKKNNKKNKKKNNVSSRRSESGEEKKEKKLAKQKKKDLEKEEEAARSSREQMQAALKAELARVYFEEFARSQDNEVDWEEGSGSGDYYYYYYDDYFE